MGISQQRLPGGRPRLHVHFRIQCNVEVRSGDFKRAFLSQLAGTVPHERTTGSAPPRHTTYKQTHGNPSGMRAGFAPATRRAVLLPPGASTQGVLIKHNYHACPTQSEHEVFDGDDEGQSGLVYTNGQPDHVATMLVEAGFPQNRIDDLYEAIQFYYNEVEDQNKAVELFKEFNHLVYNSARKSELFTENELDAIKKAARRRAPHGG